MNKKAILAIAVLVALIGGAVLVMRLPRGQAEQHWTLPDGTELTFLKVTYGPKHEARYGNRWQDYLGSILSEKLRTRLGSRVATYKPSDTNAIVVWMKEKGLSTPPAWRISDNILTVADANGTESASQYPRVNLGVTPANGERVYNWEMPNFPRRSSELKVIIYSRAIPNGGQITRIGEVKIPNPARQTGAPQWTPETLPAKRTTNGLEVSLLKLETGLTESEARMGFGAEKARIISRAAFYLRENGRKATNWSIGKIHPSAETGESFEPGTYGGGWQWAEIPFNFQGALWTEEPAWKIRTELWRTADFPAEELWTVKGISVPGLKEITEVGAKTNIYGAEVELQGIAGRGARAPKGWDWDFSGGGGMSGATLIVRLPSLPSDVHLELVRMTDDHGRVVNPFGTSTSRGERAKYVEYGFGMQIPDGAKTMDVTLGVSKAVTVEFLAKPTLYKEAAMRPTSR